MVIGMDGFYYAVVIGLYEAHICHGQHHTLSLRRRMNTVRKAEEWRV